MRFVALDLETTGLDPQKDTIIEIAAILFDIEETQGVFRTIIRDERSMLINPDRELSEEISLITGITHAMLDGKPFWNTVQERVRQFLEDAVIVGHNVLFDISMLSTHGIDLTDRTVIDTFELSEIFSQDSESLNLGFLGKRYGLSTDEDEHRALSDTRLSISLFGHYLNEGRALNEIKKSILKLMETKEEKKSIGLYNELIKIGNVDYYHLLDETSSKKEHSEEIQGNNRERLCLSLDGGRESEMDIILTEKERNEKLNIVVPGKKLQNYMSQLLRKRGIDNIEAIEPSRWCSIDEIKYMIDTIETWKRKEVILIGKLLFWLGETKTGLLEELKFYGEERSYLRFLRAQEDEWGEFRRKHAQSLKMSRCNIYDMTHFVNMSKEAFLDCIIIKDIPLIENITRKQSSITIDTGLISQDLRSFPNTKNLLYTFYILIDLYQSVPQRPTGEGILPPGGFGETYFFSQKELWEKKGKWLILFSDLLQEYLGAWQAERISNSRRDDIRIKNIDACMYQMIRYSKYAHNNIGVILTMSNEGEYIRYIPGNVAPMVRNLLEKISIPRVISYGNKIDGEIVSQFLKNECGIPYELRTYAHGQKAHKHITIKKHEEVEIAPGTIILGTNLRQLRELGIKLKMSARFEQVLIQGISGGKGKMLSLFQENIDNSVLLGLIDTWQDECTLWEECSQIIIMKLPFDPPSDPYFLSRTVGMKDNFSDYSQPTAIIKINTLISRILLAGYLGEILCLDERLDNTVWGKKIARELL